MNINKVISTLKIFIFSTLLILSTNSVAGYMVNYSPDPFVHCNECPASHAHHYYRHYKHRHYSHSRSHYSISVYYTWTPYPDYSCYQCSNCQPCACASRCQTCNPCNTCNHDNQSAFYRAPVRNVDTCSGCRESRSYDTSTADDNYEY